MAVIRAVQVYGKILVMEYTNKRGILANVWANGTCTRGNETACKVL